MTVISSYPVCRAESDRRPELSLFSPLPAKEELVCKVDDDPKTQDSKALWQQWTAWDRSHRSSLATSFAAELFKGSPWTHATAPLEDPWSLSLAGLALAPVLGLSGCAETTPSKPTETLTQGAALVSGEFHGRYDLLGDPEKFGEIFFYRQSYGSMPDMDNKLASLDGYESTIEYQWHLLKALESNKPKHVFVEDLPIDFPPGDRASLMKYIKDGLGDFVNFFSKYDLPSQREPKYFQLLAAYKQVALIYAYKHPEVYLHRVVEPAESRELQVRLEQLEVRHQGNSAELRKDPEFQRVMFELPEAYAVREIMKFYKAHPREPIGLIFGKMDNFCDNFQAIHYLPRIASFWWSEPTDSIAIPKACE